MPNIKKTTEQYIKEARIIHGNKYDYSKTIYTRASNKIIITCPIHGDFEQRAQAHLLGQGCRGCQYDAKKSNINEWIKKAQRVHQNPDGTSKYDYSQSVYEHAECMIKIICPIHGEFIQRADMHLQGQGCPKCGNNSMIKKLTKTTEQFIKEARNIHGNTYNYDKVEYIGKEIPIIITCKYHGDFEQWPITHLRGSGCPKCGKINIRRKLTDSADDFISKAIIKHQNENGTPKYDYSKVKYANSKINVIITCPIHGDFEQLPNNHLSGMGCPKCALNSKNSRGEIEIYEFLKTYINCEQNNRTILNGRELDIFIPSLNIAIEFNGLYWHSEIYRYKKYHINKTKECESKGIRLIQIFEDEWLYKKEIVKSRLLQLIGKTKYKGYARQCFIDSVPIDLEKQFLNENHLQGYINSQICFGLYYDTGKNIYLVALMSFGKLRKNLGSKSEEDVWEMYRFCTRQNFRIIGAASKLFKHFIKQFKPKQVISYADRRYSSRLTKTLYDQLGFEFDSETEPGYFYLKGGNKINRYQLRKDILISKYGCPKEKTEHQFCYEQGWYQIYDCGQLKYIWLAK